MVTAGYSVNSVIAQAEYCGLVLCFKERTCALQIAESNFFYIALIIKYWGYRGGVF